MTVFLLQSKMDMHYYVMSFLYFSSIDRPARNSVRGVQTHQIPIRKAAVNGRGADEEVPNSAVGNTLQFHITVNSGQPPMVLRGEQSALVKDTRAAK